MRKRIIYLLAVVSCLLATLPARAEYQPINAHQSENIWLEPSNGYIRADFEVDGIYYFFMLDNNVGVTRGEVRYSGSVTIPQYVDYTQDGVTVTYNVTFIGGGTFEYCDELTSVFIPNSVTSIQGNTFRGCSNLTNFSIPDSVTDIGDKAFWGCSSLTGITIPESVTSIGDMAFYGCSSLVGSICIPESVTYIGRGAFGHCSSISSIVVESGNSEYDSRDNCNAIIETSSNKLISGCSNTIIPNNITAIGDYAFCGSKVTSVDLSNLVTEIGYSAFEGCENLKNVDIPNSVTSIGGYAFSGCSALTSIAIPNSVTSIKEGTFSGCTGLTSVVIPNSVTTIGINLDDVWYGGAFSGCTNLTSVDIPNSVTWIGPNSFARTGLTSVTIPNSVTTICDCAFFECDNLNSVSINDLSAWCNIDFSSELSNPLYYAKHLIFKDKDIDIMEIPNGVERVNQYAFINCIGLSSVTIPNSVTSIGQRAFQDCIGLTAVSIPNSMAEIGYAAFVGCNNLTSIIVESENKKFDSRDECNAIIETETNTLILGCKNSFIPNSVVAIADDAFRDCSGLLSMTIPNSVSVIGNYAFYNCSSMTSLSIGNSVSSIGENAFGDCSSLTSVSIPNSVTTIGRYAFYGCNGLDNITIPYSVNSIGEYAFGELTSIESHLLNPNIEVTYNDWFNNAASNPFFVSENTTLYVPKGTIEAYRATWPWNEFTNIEEFESAKGDVDYSGVVDIDDMNMVINTMLHKIETMATSDVNNDGVVDVDDMNIVINVILRKE